MAKTNYFSDKGMKELTLGEKIARPFYAVFYFLLTLSTYVFLLIVAFVIGMLVLEFNFNINKNFYDTLLEDEKKWFDAKESTNILVDNKTCQTLPLTIDILNAQQSPATYNNFDSNLYWTTQSKINKEVAELSAFRETLDVILERNDIEKLWVFTRGYADKSKSENLEYALNKKYLYNEVTYFPIHNEVFDIAQNTKMISMKNSKYKNKDLIYLRANFVKEKYYKTLLEDLAFKQSHFAVLEGKLSDKRDKAFRKVNVYMSFCKKPENLTVLDKLHNLKMKVLLSF
jgi:hypothetical protein